MNPLPIECTDPDDRMDGWQVGYFALKAKEPSYKGYDSPIVNFKDNDCKPYHPDFMPFPYREVKPKVDFEV